MQVAIMIQDSSAYRLRAKSILDQLPNIIYLG